eukprot:TRINITY_DN28165_c0_g1_i1.p1 TRINITY_DN28165_c0_g1~~TRINITY_DN28165_c0_g1_i1.p1  ORF type:complete len:512 (-),score=56.73 TRINITY_DN28165_c0_g1_i1:299-1834(-)
MTRMKHVYFLVCFACALTVNGDDSALAVFGNDISAVNISISFGPALHVYLSKKDKAMFSRLSTTCVTCPLNDGVSSWASWRTSRRLSDVQELPGKILSKLTDMGHKYFEPAELAHAIKTFGESYPGSHEVLLSDGEMTASSSILANHFAIPACIKANQSTAAAIERQAFKAAIFKSSYRSSLGRKILTVLFLERFFRASFIPWLSDYTVDVNSGFEQAIHDIMQHSYAEDLKVFSFEKPGSWILGPIRTLYDTFQAYSQLGLRGADDLVTFVWSVVEEHIDECIRTGVNDLVEGDKMESALAGNTEVSCVAVDEAEFDADLSGRSVRVCWISKDDPRRIIAIVDKGSGSKRPIVEVMYSIHARQSEAFMPSSVCEEPTPLKKAAQPYLDNPKWMLWLCNDVMHNIKRFADFVSGAVNRTIKPAAEEASYLVFDVFGLSLSLVGEWLAPTFHALGRQFLWYLLLGYIIASAVLQFLSWGVGHIGRWSYDRMMETRFCKKVQVQAYEHMVATP